jgi:hypothetical protein
MGGFKNLTTFSREWQSSTVMSGPVFEYGKVGFHPSQPPFFQGEMFFWIFLRRKEGA